MELLLFCVVHHKIYDVSSYVPLIYPEMSKHLLGTVR